MKVNTTYLKGLLILFLCIFSLSAIAQIGVPAASTSCTSKDLEIVAAKLTGGDLCNSCQTSTPLTRTLTLAINNTTGSTRGAFAFWGTIDIFSGIDGSLISSTAIQGCSGPLPGSSITTLDFGSISYKCGDLIKISNILGIERH